ncbi:MAG: hypothetical protein GF346_11605 [Candidatus Eisenbacteria bacterium]|nr:hypothetical protein [Candidatus Latescibacterota bacterium]MBD3303082.1 hypothetical protein [Candidatus Eisenbacteria bacterium]
MANPELTPYMTRDEFEAYAAGMMQTITVLLNEYARDRDQGVGVALTGLVGTLERQRDEDYRELRSRIEAVRADLAEEQLRSNLRVGDADQPGLMAPTSHTPADGLEGDQK